VDLKKEG
jgi:hypothetical protein